MKFFINSTLLATALVLVSWGASAEELKYSVRELPETMLVDTTLSGPLVQECAASTLPGTLEGTPGPLDPVEEVIDQIINIGKKVWAVIELGRPVVNLKTDVGTALPLGVKCWLDLDSWKQPTSRLYEASFTNGYDMEVIKFVYRVTALAGGGFSGVGKYVGYAAIQPVDLQVMWGYRFDAEASVPTVFNTGTKTEPVGGLQIMITYKINTVMKHVTQSQLYFVDGHGKLEIMK
jgi:hypothetical protein